MPSVWRSVLLLALSAFGEFLLEIRDVYAHRIRDNCIQILRTSRKLSRKAVPANCWTKVNWTSLVAGHLCGTITRVMVPHRWPATTLVIRKCAATTAVQPKVDNSVARTVCSAWAYATIPELRSFWQMQSVRKMSVLNEQESSRRKSVVRMQGNVSYEVIEHEPRWNHLRNVSFLGSIRTCTAFSIGQFYRSWQLNIEMQLRLTATAVWHTVNEIIRWDHGERFHQFHRQTHHRNPLSQMTGVSCSPKTSVKYGHETLAQKIGCWSCAALYYDEHTHINRALRCVNNKQFEKSPCRWDRKYHRYYHRNYTWLIIWESSVYFGSEYVLSCLRKKARSPPYYIKPMRSNTQALTRLYRNESRVR